jgi:rRNA maturation protein Nop10
MDNNSTKIIPKVLEELDRQALVDLIIRQAEQVGELRQEIEKLKKANEHLREKLETSERESHRQAAPHRIDAGKRKTNPKSPGRKVGHGAHWRPKPVHIDHHVEVPLEACPHCGETQLSEQHPITQYVEELPCPQVETTELRTWRGKCPHCGDVESIHPLKVSVASGAAGVGLGPRAQATAVSLAYQQGLTLGQACDILKELFGLDLSRGGLVQLAHRRGSDLEAEEVALARQARGADLQHVDETSWWVAGADPAIQPHWLWVFANANHTLYRIDHRRNSEVVKELLGNDFPGVLVSDCLNIYDGLYGGQQKCYAHHLKAISRAQATHQAAENACSGYLKAVKGMLKAAQALKTSAEELSEAQWERFRSGLEQTADRLLTPGRPRSRLSKPEESVRNRLWKQRSCLFVFLDHPQVGATNNLAERRLRPAVIQRKLSAGNRTDQGARTWEILVSLGATYAQQGRSFLEHLMQVASFKPESLALR